VGEGEGRRVEGGPRKPFIKESMIIGRILGCNKIKVVIIL
jgi:hypothetical protein